MATKGQLDGEWYSETSELWPGQAMSLKIKSMLHECKSEFQDVQVFDSETYGRVLVLDGCIQLTQRDEFSYQEMMAHLPLCSLKGQLRRVLVVGGGDGGVVREVVRHTCVEHVDCAEIDGVVPEMSRRFFPEVAVGFDDPRVDLHICDGLKFVADAASESYDVIIVDSSDPIGPASVLFTKPFFESMNRALRPGGVICTQGECMWLHLDLIKEVMDLFRQVFVGGVVTYAYTSIPTYPCGQIGFVLCSKPGADMAEFKKPVRPPPGNDKLKPLRYYNQQVHAAAFALPEFAQATLA